MGYQLYDQNGWLAGGPSLSGMSMLRTVLKGPYGMQFAEHGYTEAPSALAAELERRRAPDEDTQRSLDNLREAAQRAKGILILTTGVDLEEDIE